MITLGGKGEWNALHLFSSWSKMGKWPFEEVSQRVRKQVFILQRGEVAQPRSLGELDSLPCEQPQANVDSKVAEWTEAPTLSPPFPSRLSTNQDSIAPGQNPLQRGEHSGLRQYFQPPDLSLLQSPALVWGFYFFLMYSFFSPFLFFLQINDFYF